MTLISTKSTILAAVLLAGTAIWAPAAYAQVGQTLDEILELAKTEPPALVATTWRGEIIDAAKKGFFEKYGLTVEHEFVSGLDDRERILNEALTGQVQVDLLNVSGDLRDRFVEAGVIVDVPWATLFPDIDSQIISPTGYYLGTGMNQFVLLYNKDKVTAEDAPKTWQDCLDPRWKGDVGVYSRPLPFVQQHIAWGPDKSLEYHAALLANEPVWFSTTNSGVSLLAAGEYSIVCGMAYHAVKTILRSDPNTPIGVVVPTEFPFQVGEALAVVKNGGSPNTATLFAHYMGTEGANLYDLFGQSNPLKEGTEAWTLAHDANATLMWAGWEADGEAQSEATSAIVQAWGFPTGQ